MGKKQLRTRLGHPTAELPVEDVERAQEHYRDALGLRHWLVISGRRYRCGIARELRDFLSQKKPPI